MSDLPYHVNPAPHAAAPMHAGKTWHGIAVPTSLSLTAPLDNAFAEITAKYKAVQAELDGAKAQIKSLEADVRDMRDALSDYMQRALEAEQLIDTVKAHFKE